MRRSKLEPGSGPEIFGIYGQVTTYRAQQMVLALANARFPLNGNRWRAACRHKAPKTWSCSTAQRAMPGDFAHGTGVISMSGTRAKWNFSVYCSNPGFNSLPTYSHFRGSMDQIDLISGNGLAIYVAPYC